MAKNHCTKGHEFTPKNTRIYIDSKGITFRYCRICIRDYKKSARAKIHGAPRYNDKDVNKCTVCGLILNYENSYYKKFSCVKNDLMCKKHYSENIKKLMREYHSSEEGRSSLNKASKKANLVHPEKNKARSQARYAIIKGLIVKPSACEMCNKKVTGHALQAHHEDYSKPLEVIFLCYTCHAEADRILESKSS